MPMVLRIQIGKFRFHQYLLRANSPNLVLTKPSHYTVLTWSFSSWSISFDLFHPFKWLCITTLCICMYIIIMFMPSYRMSGLPCSLRASQRWLHALQVHKMSQRVLQWMWGVHQEGKGTFASHFQLPFSVLYSIHIHTAYSMHIM